MFECISYYYIFLFWFQFIFRGGQQAALARDSNNTTFSHSGTIANLTGRRNRLNQRQFQGIGIGSNGIIIPRRNSNDEEEDDDEDVEEGRQRMGFDRLRAVRIFLFVFPSFWIVIVVSYSSYLSKL